MIDANDVGTPEAVVDAVYRILSGRAGEARDWAGLAALCLPDARLFPVSERDGAVAVEALDLETYARSRTPLLAAADFYERDVERRVETAGNVAQIWSRYAAYRSPHGPPFQYGNGGFQLVKRENRWWLASAIWQVDPPPAR